ncbi:hypothetical protein [Pulveribacter suum]|uniref:Ribosomal protein S3AE n=1 Tax=Pulveribacter suum TaxID=2116657 RepID=A0A2P1NPP9_9BURK|nr:hypothetical protein [Pulveribacter suum]AVP59028.1 hypothetical protein C7H73_07405 [Pulveribacter suum]
MPTLPSPLRTECPPGACICQRDALLGQAADSGDLRVLLLTREEQARLLQRLESVGSLAELRRLQLRLHEQLGVHLTVEPAAQEVRSLRGIAMVVREQPGLCRKTRQSIPAAIRSALQARPQIAWALLDEGGLFEQGG